MDTTTHDHGAMLSATTTHNHGQMATTTDPHAMHRTTTGHDHGGGNDGGMSHGMMMVMHGGYKEVVVFSEWTTTDIGGFIGTCFGLFFIAFAYEGIKFVRDRVTEANANARRMRRAQAIRPSSGKELEIDEQRPYMETYWEKLISIEHLIQLVLHVTQFFVSYFLMLAVMTYNSWLCMSILIGIGVGFLFFGVRRTKINLEEDCH